jgi:predicted ester cyclase
MRSLLHRTVVAAILATGCGSSAVETPAAAPVDPRLFQDAGARATVHVKSPLEVQTAERESALAVVAAFAQDGFQGAIPKLDPEGNLRYPGLAEATDRTGALKELEDLFGAFAGRAVTVGRVWQPPHVVVVEWTLTGTQAREWLSVKPTQKQVSIHGVVLLWFDTNGLVADTHLYFDAGAVLAQLGGAPKGIEAPASAPMGTGVVIPTDSDAEKQNVSIVNGSWDAFEGGKEAGYLAPLADDIAVFRLDRAPERGTSERKKFYRWLHGGIGSLQQTPLNAWGVGPFVIEEYSITGAQSGKLTDAPVTDHALELHFLDIDELKDGKIISTWTFGNSLELYSETRAFDRAAPGAPPVTK